MYYYYVLQGAALRQSMSTLPAVLLSPYLTATYNASLQRTRRLSRQQQNVNDLRTPHFRTWLRFIGFRS